jgi:hypothetical protein
MENIKMKSNQIVQFDTFPTSKSDWVDTVDTADTAIGSPTADGRSWYNTLVTSNKILSTVKLEVLAEGNMNRSCWKVMPHSLEVMQRSLEDQLGSDAT